MTGLTCSKAPGFWMVEYFATRVGMCNICLKRDTYEGVRICQLANYGKLMYVTHGMNLTCGWFVLYTKFYILYVSNGAVYSPTRQFYKEQLED